MAEATLLYRTIQEHWATFLADLESGGGELPAFVLNEFEAYSLWHSGSRLFARPMQRLRA